MKLKPEHITPLLDDLTYLSVDKGSSHAAEVLMRLSIPGAEITMMPPIMQTLTLASVASQLDKAEEFVEWWKSFKERYGND